MTIRITNNSDSRGAVPARYFSLNGASPQDIDGELVEEGLACISINGEELATFMCSPRDLEKLALGFLLNEGIITGLADVADLRIAANGTCVDVWLTRGEWSRPRRTIITAGCGGGITFDDLSQMHPPLDATTQATPTQLADLMRQMHLGAELYQRARGIHTAALADNEKLLLQVEDLGRHNCLDKLRGWALLDGIETKGKIVLSSGRISSEMINKARQLGTPIVCSRTSPTSLSVALAEAWNMTIVAYLRQDRMRVYTHPERILDTERLRD